MEGLFIDLTNRASISMQRDGVHHSAGALSDLGIAFCENVETYAVAKQDAMDGD